MSESSTPIARADAGRERAKRASGKIDVSDLALEQVVSLAKETPVQASEVSLKRRGGNSYLISRT